MEEIQSIFATKRKRLKREMDVAENLLKENMNSISIGSYIKASAHEMIPDAVDNFVHDPIDAFLKLDFVAGRFMSHKNILRRIIKNISIVIKGYRLFFPNDHESPEPAPPPVPVKTARTTPPVAHEVR